MLNNIMLCAVFALVIAVPVSAGEYGGGGNNDSNYVYVIDEVLRMERVERTVGIFEYIGDIYHIALIEPQYVRVLAQEEDWLLIESWLGEVWLYRNFQPPHHKIDAFLSRFSGRIAVFYENLETGFIYYLNPDRPFNGASAIKAPYALWVYKLAEAGYTDLSRMHTFREADRWGGSGIIRNMASGVQFSEAELLRLTLSYSDNVAFRMLVRRIHGVDGFRDFVAEAGANPAQVHTVTYSHLTARVAGLFARKIHEYIESGQTYSEHFRHALIGNRYRFISSDHLLASKSGWISTDMHDIAIVYAPSPYTLSILTTAGPGVMNIFNEVSMFFQNFNSTYFE